MDLSQLVRAVDSNGLGTFIALLFIWYEVRGIKHNLVLWQNHSGSRPACNGGGTGSNKSFGKKEE